MGYNCPNCFIVYSNIFTVGGIQRRRQREIEIFEGANPYPKK